MAGGVGPWRRGAAATRREAGAWIVPYLEAVAALAAGIAAAAPAVVAMASQGAR